MREAEIHVAIIGAGAIAEQAHLPAWSEVESARVVAVVDRDLDRARRVAGDWGIPYWHQDYEAILGDPDIDAFDVCVPPAFHAEIALAAIDAGKHVLLEKPMTIDLAEAKRLVHTAEDSQLTLMIAENWPFASAAERAFEILADGIVGDPFLLQANHHSDLYLEREMETSSWLNRPESAGRGYLLQAGIHTVNLARCLLGEIDSIQAFALPANSPIEHSLVLAVRFEQGALGSMNFTGRSQHLGERRLEFKLFCTDGIVEFDIWSGRVSWTAKGTRTNVEVTLPSRGFQEEIEHFLECILLGGEPRTSASDQLHTLAAVHAAYRSLDEGRPIRPEEVLNSHG